MFSCNYFVKYYKYVYAICLVIAVICNNLFGFIESSSDDVLGNYTGGVGESWLSFKWGFGQRIQHGRSSKAARRPYADQKVFFVEFVL